MSVKLFGFSWDASSSYARGAAHGPAVIKTLLTSDASSPYSIGGADFRKIATASNFDELPADAVACREEISDRIDGAFADRLKPLSFGGDHSVTFPILQAVKSAKGPVNILHIDAHTDLYDQFDGDSYSHACPFARAIEHGCVQNLVQVGLRSIGPEQQQFGEKHGVVMLGAEDIDQIPYEKLNEPLYVSIDLDGLDPAFAPGVSHPEPGGLSTREILRILSLLPAKPLGADVVELNPEKDVNLATAHVAVRLAKELAALMA